jgi:hypothetical protein
MSPGYHPAPFSGDTFHGVEKAPAQRGRTLRCLDHKSNFSLERIGPRYKSAYYGGGRWLNGREAELLLACNVQRAGLMKKKELKGLTQYEEDLLGLSVLPCGLRTQALNRLDKDGNNTTAADAIWHPAELTSFLPPREETNAIDPWCQLKFESIEIEFNPNLRVSKLHKLESCGIRLGRYDGRLQETPASQPQRSLEWSVGQEDVEPVQEEQREAELKSPESDEWFD